METTTSPIDLAFLLGKVKSTQSLIHLTWVRETRDYMNTKGEMAVVEELRTITDNSLLMAMLEVGARGPIYHYIIDRIGRC